jgi:hypothetical protein
MSRFRTELPFLLGLLVACLLLLRPGVLFFGDPCGSDWATYIENAAALWHPEWSDLSYQDWRKPLHAFAVGLLGESLGYVRSAQWITLGSTVALVLGAGLLARGLGGRGSGVAAALMVALLPSLEQSGRWVNVYPLLAGLCALGLGVAALCLRWPRWPLAGLSGLLAGLCWAADPRGGLVAVLALATVMLAAWVVRERPRLALGLVVAAGLGLAVGWGLDLGLQGKVGRTTRSFVDQVEVQSQVSLGPRLPPAVREACEGSIEDRLTQHLGCASALWPHNQAELASMGALPPLGWLALLLPALLPAPWGRRSSLGSLLLLGGPLAAMALGMALVHYPERYVLPQVVAVVVLLPLGLQRAGDLLAASTGRERPLVPVGAAVLAAVVFVWPGLPPWTRAPADHCRAEGIPVEGLSESRQAVLAWTRGGLGPGDLLLDCSGSAFDLRLLPLRGAIRDAPPNSATCELWLREPPSAEGQVWLVGLQSGDDPRLPPTLLTPERALREGWRPITMQGLETDAVGLTLWRR